MRRKPMLLLLLLPPRFRYNFTIPTTPCCYFFSLFQRWWWWWWRGGHGSIAHHPWCGRTLSISGLLFMFFVLIVITIIKLANNRFIIVLRMRWAATSQYTSQDPKGGTNKGREEIKIVNPISFNGMIECHACLVFVFVFVICFVMFFLFSLRWSNLWKIWCCWLCFGCCLRVSQSRHLRECFVRSAACLFCDWGDSLICFSSCRKRREDEEEKKMHTSALPSTNCTAQGYTLTRRKKEWKSWTLSLPMDSAAACLFFLLLVCVSAASVGKTSMWVVYATH